MDTHLRDNLPRQLVLALFLHRCKLVAEARKHVANAEQVWGANEIDIRQHGLHVLYHCVIGVGFAQRASKEMSDDSIDECVLWLDCTLAMGGLMI